ncbi:MAG TPA: hypothetical protein VLA12_15815, partial [Planctomycetaceae bacterium]|nr:hypothetical protein [Planctomycetaceae bacterium]
MDDFDDAMLSYALRDEFPTVKFFNKTRLLHEPRLIPSDTIPECDETLVHIWFPRENWEPLFFPHPDYPSRFNVINPPYLYLHYNRT